ncbi:hypothetical protein OGAPHI_007001 [Ogataea philodendri]|uniref:RWD domain-containing protein n=1 Tax=Ogataea philodendri TaxID=1378263 RepID=A0A9P8NVR3_9ASCO|nr:uncharacterized protein OGAPHI_007001 [Ogataea philodendri]KAH3660415.1 hypothetical protein OGAPHI_007001 [Ogataea philodendri]
MDYLEEQKQEIEILQSIYPDELEIVSETSFRVSLLLDTNTERKHTLILNVRYPETYPEVVPQLRLEKTSDDVPEESLNVEESVELDKDDLLDLEESLNSNALENVGMPSVFTLTSLLKDEAETLFQEKVAAKEKMVEQERQAREYEEQKKFAGTKLTKENFAQWRAKFRAEMGIDTRLAERFKLVHQGRLTGKEIFEKGLAEEAEDL